VTVGAAFSIHWLLHQLRELPPAPRYWVAFSGGLDSTILLHSMVDIASDLNCEELLAVHVNHRQSPEADQRSRHCSDLCEGLGVALRVLTIDTQKPKGMSNEDWLRRQRYALLAEAMGDGDVMFTAHHLNDQAETLLLQLLRGSGPRGLAGMPRIRQFGGGYLARPLLAITRAGLEEFAEARLLSWCDDPSNIDRSLDRNYLRHEIIPLLAKRWPGIFDTIGRAAIWQAQMVEVLDDLATADLSEIRDADGRLSISRLRELPQARQQEVLRQNLRTNDLPVPSSRIIDEVLHEVCDAREDAEPHVIWPGAEVRRYQDKIYVQSPLSDVDSTQIRSWDFSAALQFTHGRLEAKSTTGHGLSRERLESGQVTVRFRRGGERIRSSGRAHHSDLKKLLQAWLVPPWLRNRIPLIYCGDELVCVVGYVIDEAFKCSPDEAGWTLDWVPLDNNHN
jgi:tRNA(Ile)-lysidine synthase